jgi:hypothetical protein
MSDNHTIDSYIVMTTSAGYWGKSKTIEKAIENAKWIEAGDEVRVIACDSAAYIDDVGGLIFNARYVIGVGKVSRNRKSVRIDL